MKSKIIYSFESIYGHGLVPEITSLSVFLIRRPESLLLTGRAKSLVLKKCFCLIRKYALVSGQMRHVDFRKMSIVSYKEIRSFFQIKFVSFKLPRSVFSRLEISMVLMEFFAATFEYNLSLSCRSKWEWYYSSLSGSSPNTE